MARTKATNVRGCLLVEGDDDLFSIVGVMKGHVPDWDQNPLMPFVIDGKGYPNVFSKIPSALTTYERVGIVVDADAVPSDRYDAVIEELRKAGVIISTPLTPGGLVHELPAEARKSGRLTHVGVWLMPDHQSGGELEDFLVQIAPTTTLLWQHAEDATTVACNAKSAPLPSRHRSKGILHAWLAWQEDAGLPLGSSVERGLLDARSAATVSFVAWFNRLFVA